MLIATANWNRNWQNDSGSPGVKEVIEAELRQHNANEPA